MRKYPLLALSWFSTSLFAEVQLSPLPLAEIGKAAQFDLSEQGQLIVINQKQELWRLGDKAEKLLAGVSTEIEPKARYGRIAAADSQGHFLLWTADKTYGSAIVLARNATMEALAFATIAVTHENRQAKLVRIETEGEQARITAVAQTPVLPDAHPLQIDFDGENANQGHIAVLAKPDRTTYRHGVLGDDIEATEIQFLERHSLEPLAQTLSPQGSVFEANRFATLSQNGKTKLVSVLSGNGNGAKTVLIGVNQGKLAVEAESEALPTNRWQSPFGFNGKLYAVQMPHLNGQLVEYRRQGEKLAEKVIANGLSNHSYGEYETNLAAAADNFAVVPKTGYRQIAVLDKTGSLTELAVALPAEIRQSKAGNGKVYLRLSNGDIWIAEEK